MCSPRWSIRSHPPPQCQRLTHRAQNDLRAATSGFTSDAGVVMDPNLLQSCPLSARLGLDLGVDQRSRRGEWQLSQEVAAKELEGAVDISQVNTEQHPHRN